MLSLFLFSSNGHTKHKVNFITIYTEKTMLKNYTHFSRPRFISSVRLYILNLVHCRCFLCQQRTSIDPYCRQGGLDVKTTRSLLGISRYTPMNSYFDDWDQPDNKYLCEHGMRKLARVRVQVASKNANILTRSARTTFSGQVANFGK